MREKLTVLIPCKNERRNLTACVDSVRELADEILVADSGSTDGTLDIVRRLPDCRLIERDFRGYADFKNWAIAQARYPWVFIVDADERMTPDLRNEVRALLEGPPADRDGFWVGFQCFFMGHLLRFAGWNTPALRLFRRDRCRYEPRPVHEEMSIAPARAGRLKHRLLHFSYWSYDQFFAKWITYTRLGAEHLRSRGRRAGVLSLTARPVLRFLQLYLLRGGCLDGLPGLQVCVLTAFFNTFGKQARLWELQQRTRRCGRH